MTVPSTGPTVRARPAGGSKAAGFSLVEVAVAMVILAVGVLGLGATTLHVVRGTMLADLTAERGAARRAVVEEVRASPWDSVDLGTDTVGRFAVSWEVTVETAAYKELAVTTVGPGTVAGTPAGTIHAAATDTLTYRIIKP